MFNGESEIAGDMQLTIRAFADKDLDSVMAAVNELLQIRKRRHC
jgi:hypothetical protein